MYLKNFAVVLIASIGILGATKPLNMDAMPELSLDNLSTPAKAAPIPYYGIPLPEGYRIHGLDISHYQSYINWNNIKTIGTEDVKFSFVFIRATMGANRVDRNFQTNWYEAKQAGFLRAPYHFYDPHQNVITQVSNFLTTVKMEPGDLPPVLDIEKAKRFRRNRDLASFQNAIHTWLTMVEKATGVKPIIYSGYKFYHDYLASRFGNYPLWIAYYDQPELVLPNNRKWHFWQHSDQGRVNGINGYVDMNVFNGDEDDLAELCIATHQKKIELPPVVYVKASPKSAKKLKSLRKGGKKPHKSKKHR